MRGHNLYFSPCGECRFVFGHNIVRRVRTAVKIVRQTVEYPSVFGKLGDREFKKPSLSVLIISSPPSASIFLYCSRKLLYVRRRFAWRAFGHGSLKLRNIVETEFGSKISVICAAFPFIKRRFCGRPPA